MEDKPFTPLFELFTRPNPRFKEALEGVSWIDRYLSQLAVHSVLTFEHSQRVAHIADEVGSLLPLQHEDRWNLIRAGLLHDIGKLRIPVTLLNADSLSEADKVHFDMHPRLGFEMVNPIDSALARIVVAHHEFQERPYPRRMPRNADEWRLFILQRILALSDATDALMSRRPYKEPYSRQDTRRLLEGRFPRDFIEKAISARSK